jgi:hypothetical protein
MDLRRTARRCTNVLRPNVTGNVAVAEIDPWLQPGETERLKTAIGGLPLSHCS